MDNKKTIDCALLPYENQCFLLPTIAMEKAFLLEEYQIEENMPAPFWFGTMQWDNASIPIVTMNLSAVSQYKQERPRVALVHALFSSDRFPPHFAILFDNKVQRVRIAPEEITWADRENRTILLEKGNEKREVTVLDIYALSQAVEQSLEVTR